ncbi:MAG TPA: RNA polymerase sigma factor [Bryobacteraceae bacterium]|nr:RNA polymerase sigma factor [Bryobacteraceae bacterium]
MSGESIPFPLPGSAFAKDSPEAAKLFDELRKPLQRYLVCLGLSSEDAQDVSQDAFLQLHRHVSSGGSQENIRSWLFRVAHNQARNRQTSYHQRFATSLDASKNEMPDYLTPERSLLAKEKSRQLRAAVRSLTEAERECLMLRAEGLRYREIGEVLGIATSTVADSVDRAVRKLAEKCNV